jgi:dihydrolipoamide dehydrogenase
MAESFDLIVIGAGPAGEVVASRAPNGGLRTALIERELVGGECAYWACIPSKTLLRPGEVRLQAPRTAGTDEPAQHWDAIAAYRDFMVRNLDDGDEIESYEKQGVTVVKGAASFLDPHTLQVGEQTLTGERIVIATGSETAVPEIDGLRDAGYWTNRDVTGMSSVPGSVCVLGGGPVGIELAQLLRRFGATVIVIEHAGRLLDREHPRVGELLHEALTEDGIEVHLDSEVTAVHAAGGARTVTAGATTVTADQVLVATSREPRIDGLALENAGIEAGPKGIEVDERCRCNGADGIWAVGDVTGEMPFSHVAMYQGRIVVADILGQPARADYTAVPRCVFSDPEIAAVGVTEPEGAHQSLARVELRDAIARPWTYETDPRGELAVIADRARGVLVGAWAVGPHASEWIHYAALAIKASVPVETLTDTVAQFPTYTEAYLKALDQL